MKPDVDYSLYLCTDRSLMSTKTVEEAVEQAILGGCTVIQLREKDCSSLEFFETAQRVKRITEKYGIPLIINDRVDLSLAVDAEGVHIGQSDLPCSVVRKLIGPKKIIGVSVSSVEEAVRAVEDGADYLGVGAMYATNTKTDANLTTLDTLKAIRTAASVPIVVIGGINRSTVGDFRGTGIDGLAVVSAVIAQKDISGAARELLDLFRSQVRV